jgi:hypothetical protein
MDADELAAVLGKKPSGGHWNSGRDGWPALPERRALSEVMKTSGLRAILSDLIRSCRSTVR